MFEPTVPHTVRVPDHLLIRTIGRGAYGEVWLAENVLGTMRAVKLLFRDHFEMAGPYEREFEGVRQYEPLSRSHDGLVDILQVGIDEEQGFFYYVMELGDNAAEDSQTDQRLSYSPLTLEVHVRLNGGRLPVNETVRIGAHLASALEPLHSAGLVHRDIKPANIILVNGAPKLADAGLVAGRGGETTLVGTEGYLPREGPGEVGADIYALGIVLYETASGLHRREFPTFPEGLPTREETEEYAELNQILLKACAADAGDRYRSVRDFRAELLLAGAGQSIRRIRAGEKRLALMKRLTAIFAFAGLVLLLGYFWQRGEAARSKRLAAAESRLAAAEHANFLRIRENLYAADLAAAQRLADKGNRGAARRLLDTFLPSPGEDDLRGFDWRWLSGQLLGDPHRTLPPLNAICEYCCYDAKGKLWSTTIDGNVRRWDPLAGSQEVTDVMPEGESLFYVSVTEDGTRLFGGGNGLFRPSRTGHAPEKVVEHASLFWAVSPDGRWAAGTSRAERSRRKNEIIITDLTGAVPERTLAGSRDWAAFSPNGSLLATAGEEGVFRLWAVGQDFSLQAELEASGVSTFCLGLTFAPAGDLLAASMGEGTLLIWDLADRSVIHRIQGGTAAGAWQPAFSPSGEWLATGAGQEVWLIHVASGAIARRFIGHDDEVRCVSFSPNGKVLASAGKDGVLRLWAMDETSRRAEVEIAHLSNPPIFSADGSLLAGVLPGEPLRVWNAATLEVLASWGTEHEWPLAFTSEGGTLLTTDRFWELHAWNWREGTRQHSVRLELLDEGNGAAVALSPDGRWLCGGTFQGLVVIWDTASGKVVRRLTGHTHSVERLVFSPDGRWLATSGDDRQVRLWNTQTWDATLLAPHGHIARGLAFSADGRWLATSCWDGLARIFDLPSGALSQSLAYETSSLDGICFSPDSAILAVARADRKISLRDTRTWRETIELPGGDRNEFHHLAFSPDGTLLLGNSDDGLATQAWRSH